MSTLTRPGGPEGPPGPPFSARLAPSLPLRGVPRAQLAQVPWSPAMHGCVLTPLTGALPGQRTGVGVRSAPPRRE